MATRGDVFERVAADLEAGRPWKARDRLTSLVKAEPANQRALELVGEGAVTSAKSSE